MNNHSLKIKAQKGYLPISASLEVFGKLNLPLKEPLEWNAISIDLGNDKQISIVSIDAFFAGKPDNESFWFLASHSHSAPPLTFSKSEMVKGDADYINNFNQSLLLNTASFKEVVMTCKSFHLGGVLNRRKISFNLKSWKNQAQFAPEEPTSTLEPAQLFEFKDLNGNLLAIVFIWACHPVAQSDFLSPDYIGLLRSYLRKKYENPVLPVLFWQGAAGDLRPALITFEKTICEMIRVQGPVFLKPNAKQLLNWWTLRQAELDNQWESQSEKIKHNFLIIKELKIALSDILDNYIGSIKYLEINLLIVGENYFLFFSAEPLSGWNSKLKALWPEKKVFVLGYLNECFGYLPTQKDVKFGGYEVNGFMKPFNLSGIWKPDFEKIITDKLNQLINEK